MTCDQPWDGWTLVLRRQPARIVEGQPEGGYTGAFEIIYCDCGDHPDQDYREVPPKLQLVRGPYPIADGVAAYEQHRRLHQQLGVPSREDDIRCWLTAGERRVLRAGVHRGAEPEAAGHRSAADQNRRSHAMFL